MELTMADLLYQKSDIWETVPLPDSSTQVLLGMDHVEITPQIPAVLPENTFSIILRGKTGSSYHIPTGQAQVYWNANPQPERLPRLLSPQDRLTCTIGGATVRVWFLPDTSQVYTSDMPSLRCGYCQEKVAEGEAIVRCECGESTHLDCRQHASGRCPRCGAELVIRQPGWRPETFPAPDREGDKGEYSID